MSALVKSQALTLTLSISAWVQVDLLLTKTVSGLLIQARKGSGQRVTALQLLYSNNASNWQKATVDENDVS